MLPGIVVRLPCLLAHQLAETATDQSAIFGRAQSRVPSEHGDSAQGIGEAASLARAGLASLKTAVADERVAMECYRPVTGDSEVVLPVLAGLYTVHHKPHAVDDRAGD